jgi:hypothetical protein
MSAESNMHERLGIKVFYRVNTLPRLVRSAVDCRCPTFEHVGAGLCCNASSYDPQEIQDIISIALNDSRYQARAAELAERFGSYDSCGCSRGSVRRITGKESPAYQEELR